MSNQGTYIAVDVGGDRITVASAEGDLPGPARTLRIGHAADAASSAVFVDEDGFVHGDTAAQRAMAEPGRLLRGYADRVGDAVPLQVAGRTLRPEDVLAGVIEWAATYGTEAVTDAVAGVTTIVPASWGPHRRMQLTAALDARGMSVSLVTAPVAVTHASRATGTLAVYDLGADSCELAVVRVTTDRTELLGAATVADLGGADFDDAVVAHVCEYVPSARGASGLAAALLRRAATAAKEALSFDAETAIPVILPDGEHLVRLVRSEFETLIEDDILRTARALEDLLDEVGVRAHELSALVLVGGSSRIPRVAQLLSERFPVPLDVDADPQSVAARGAARAAAIAGRAAPPPTEAEDAADGEGEPPAASPAAPRARLGGIRRAYDAVLRALTPPALPGTPSGADASADAPTAASATRRMRAGV